MGAKGDSVQGLWRGTAPAVLLTVPYCAVQFVVLKQCKAYLHERGMHNTNLVRASSFVSGAVAGAAATLASYPFDLVRTILAAQGEPRVHRGMVDVASSIVREHGIRGMYSGVGITLMEIMPYAAIQFGSYDLLKTSLKNWQDTNGIDDTRQTQFARQFGAGLLAGMAGKVRAAAAGAVQCALIRCA